MGPRLILGASRGARKLVPELYLLHRRRCSRNAKPEGIHQAAARCLPAPRTRVMPTRSRKAVGAVQGMAGGRALEEGKVPRRGRTRANQSPMNPAGFKNRKPAEETDQPVNSGRPKCETRFIALQVCCLSHAATPWYHTARQPGDVPCGGCPTPAVSWYLVTTQTPPKPTLPALGWVV